jgi:hypothetical protein
VIGARARRFGWKQESSRFLKKAAQKTFGWAGPVALRPARPRLKKFLRRFF